jgi:protein TIF31
MNKELTSNKYVKTLEQISYSSFNPVPAARKLAGDLFYLSVKTLDAGEKGITCCVNGFYVNESVEKGAFSPGPSQKRNAQGKQTGAFSYTLIGCLNQISPSFGKNL